MKSGARVGLSIALAALLLWAAAPALTQPHFGVAPPGLTGTWTVKVTFNGVLHIKYLQNFTHGGQTTLLLPFGGPVNATDTRVGCMGEWRPSRPWQHSQTFDMTMKCLVSQEWDFAGGYGFIKAKLIPGPDGKTFTGEFSYEGLDEAGNKLWGGTGIMEAVRLEIVPFE